MAEPQSDFPTDGAAPPAAPRGPWPADLPLRAATGVTMMALALGAAWAGGFPFLVFWGLAALGVAWEWQRLIGGERVWERVGATALALVASAPFALHGQAILASLALGVGALLTGLVADRGHRVGTGLGVVYSGVLVVGANLLRASPQYGWAAVLWLFAVVWGTDVMAYFGGRFIGGPKLWPSVSPGKTWSGAIVGALASALLGALIAKIAAPEGARLAPMLILGLATSILAQVGDLLESALKRRAGVKDSSRLIPGHGGLMDRLDGFILALAFASIVAAWRSTGAWIAPGLFQW